MANFNKRMEKGNDWVNFHFIATEAAQRQDRGRNCFCLQAWLYIVLILWLSLHPLGSWGTDTSNLVSAYPSCRSDRTSRPFTLAWDSTALSAYHSIQTAVYTISPAANSILHTLHYVALLANAPSELLAKSAQQASKSCLWKVAAMQRDLRGKDMMHKTARAQLLHKLLQSKHQNIYWTYYQYLSIFINYPDISRPSNHQPKPQHDSMTWMTGGYEYQWKKTYIVIWICFDL